MEAENRGNGATVCVTGASGFIGSWLVKRLLEQGYFVRATGRDPGRSAGMFFWPAYALLDCFSPLSPSLTFLLEQGYFVRATGRDPANLNKVKHLLDLPKAETHLSLWKAELTEEGSFDDAIEGCAGVFHVATPMELSFNDLENEVIKPTVNGVLNIMRSCCKAKTVKRLIYTSSTGTVANQRHPQPEFNESFWTDIDFCKEQKMTAWMYFVAKTMAEKAAWEFAKEHGLDLVTIQPSAVIGPFITPSRPISIDVSLSVITRNEALYSLTRGGAVHLDDVCSAHIYLFEHPEAEGRYICSSHCFTILDLAKSLSRRYPEYNITTKFEGGDESLKPVPCSSKKLMDLGFKFKYNPEEHDVGDLVSDAIESCREKGLMPV